MSRYTDLYAEQDGEGLFDFVIENGDLKTTDGLDSAIIVSLFSDRRAYADQVADPCDRRGWIGDLVPPEPGDMHGSHLWLYDQSRLTRSIAVEYRSDAVAAFHWLEQDGFISYADAVVLSYPENRRITLDITLNHLDGNVTRESYRLADATRAGILARV